MKYLNSNFTIEQINLIMKKQKEYRMFYALYFKHYEIKVKFFGDFPKFSGSLVTNISKKLQINRKIIFPSERVRYIYQQEIKKYFDIDNKKCQELVKNCIDSILPTKANMKLIMKK